MSLEQNKNNVDLKELYDTYEYSKTEYLNRQNELDTVENRIKVQLKKAIEKLRSNAQFDAVTSEAEKTEIDQLYLAVQDARQ